MRSVLGRFLFSPLLFFFFCCRRSALGEWALAMVPSLARDPRPPPPQLSITSRTRLMAMDGFLRDWKWGLARRSSNKKKSFVFLRARFSVEVRRGRSSVLKLSTGRRHRLVLAELAALQGRHLCGTGRSHKLPQPACKSRATPALTAPPLLVHARGCLVLYRVSLLALVVLLSAMAITRTSLPQS